MASGHLDLRRLGQRRRHAGGHRLSVLRLQRHSGLSSHHKHDQSYFTGVLLDQATGKILPAGQEVIFTADGSRYLATVQPDGMEGQEWYVYARDGGVAWEGLSGIVENGPSYPYLVAELGNPRWTARGELQAKLTRSIGPDRKSDVVTLTRQNGGWAWLPSVVCPKGDSLERVR